jgi:hypothetical protein
VPIWATKQKPGAVHLHILWHIQNEQHRLWDATLANRTAFWDKSWFNPIWGGIERPLPSSSSQLVSLPQDAGCGFQPSMNIAWILGLSVYPNSLVLLLPNLRTAAFWLLRECVRRADSRNLWICILLVRPLFIKINCIIVSNDSPLKNTGFENYGSGQLWTLGGLGGLCSRSFHGGAVPATCAKAAAPTDEAMPQLTALG